jgi:hypothetical protein
LSIATTRLEGVQAMDSDYEGYEEYRDDLEAWETEQVFRDLEGEGEGEWLEMEEAERSDAHAESLDPSVEGRG